jgi:hypothetical protein
MRRAGTDLRRFPCSLINRSTEEAPNLAPATSPRLPRSTSPQPPLHPLKQARGVPLHRPPANDQHQVRVASGPDPPGSSRCVFEGRKRRFLAYAFPPRSPGPHHLAVLTRPGFVRAASTQTRHLPGQAALSFAVLLRQNHGRGLSPPLNQQAPHGAPESKPTAAGRCDNPNPAPGCGDHPTTASTSSTPPAPTPSATPRTPRRSGTPPRRTCPRADAVSTLPSLWLDVRSQSDSLIASVAAQNLHPGPVRAGKGGHVCSR